MYIKNSLSWKLRMLRLQKVLDRDIRGIEGITTDRYYAIRNAEERLIYWRNWAKDVPPGCTCVMCEAQKGTTVAKAEFMCNEARMGYADYVEEYPDREVIRTPVVGPDNWPDRPLM